MNRIGSIACVKLRYFLLVMGFMGVFVGYGQSVDCGIAGYAAQACFTHEAFVGFRAAFSEKEPYFVYQSGKKLRTLPYAEPMNDTYLVHLGMDRSLKLGSLDLLFIDRALAYWAVERLRVGYEETESGLGVKVLRQGNGALTVAGDTVWVHYTGYFENGTTFDSSRKRGAPFSFVLGEGRVIKGWDEGVALLQKGTRAWLKIPPDLGYGKRQRGPIPPNSTLIFDIEILNEK